MVQLIPDNANPTMAEIDAYIRESRMTTDGMTALKHGFLPGGYIVDENYYYIL